MVFWNGTYRVLNSDFLHSARKNPKTSSSCPYCAYANFPKMLVYVKFGLQRLGGCAALTKISLLTYAASDHW